LVCYHKRPFRLEWKAGPVYRGPAASILIAFALIAPACVPEGLAFVQDTRVEILAPKDRIDVEPPVTIVWEVEDFEITGPDGRSNKNAGYFGVFVDVSPIPPGKELSWIAKNDQICLSTPGCPDKTYFSDHHAYETEETEFTLKQLPDLNVEGGHETHEVTIVLLDGTGHRIGESAWYVTFFYDREEL
jgi:hypothetical protein